jgi:hypothetical protein
LPGCANGAHVKPGIAPTTQILVDRSLWEAVTGTASTWFDWLLDIFTPQTITASDLCALNLPDPVLPNVLTLAAAFFKDPSSIREVYDFVRDKLRYAAFAATCECNTTTGGPGTPCTTQGPVSITVANTTDGACGFANPCHYWNEPIGVISGFYPAGQHHIRLTHDIPGGWTYQIYTPGTGFSVAIGNLGIGPGSIEGEDPSLPSQWQAVFVGGRPHNATVEFWAAANESPCSVNPYPPQPVHVDTQPPTLPVPPAWGCTTIADVCARLQQVDQKIDWLIRSAPIPITQSVAESTVHSALSGTGTLAVSAILGVRVSVVAPPWAGSRPGNPPTYFRLGRIDWETSEGWRSTAQLDVTPKEILFGQDPVTLVGYSLETGVTASITELVRGP